MYNIRPGAAFGVEPSETVGLSCGLLLQIQLAKRISITLELGFKYLLFIADILFS